MLKKMRKTLLVEKGMIPEFHSDEEEAQYWDTHSPLELIPEPRPAKIRTSKPKDRPVTIRLDTETRSKLEKHAAEQSIGPSTLARLILVATLNREAELELAEQPRATAETTLTKRATDEKEIAHETQSLLRSRRMLKEALSFALDGDWQSASVLSRDAISSVSDEHTDSVGAEAQLIWTCIQRVSVKPLLERAETLVSSWDYREACKSLADVINICKAVRMPLAHELCVRAIKIGMATCNTAAEWRSGIDIKLNQVLTAVDQLPSHINETVARKLDKELVAHSLPMASLSSHRGADN